MKTNRTNELLFCRYGFYVWRMCTQMIAVFGLELMFSSYTIHRHPMLKSRKTFLLYVFVCVGPKYRVHESLFPVKQTN